MAEESPFASFVPSTEAAPVASGPKAKKPRKKKAVAPAAQAAPPAPKSEKPARKPRVVKAPRKARAIKIDLSLAMTALAGLQEADAKFVMGVVQAMQAFGKKQRARIVAALSKVFAC